MSFDICGAPQVKALGENALLGQSIYSLVHQDDSPVLRAFVCGILPPPHIQTLIQETYARDLFEYLLAGAPE